ncbi:MAG: sugar ABC transporter permease [Sphaerochaeta sp.]|jgi:putative multiple sugar transport system permease protein|uniref:multiple monosaccharide ABC transporter permease n=1 Tax=Sphaerochaeta sp. TaxID=1972642 RepID=UPI002A36CD31|nr:multiple monosaccharide ABC transporter permease [Sphaerochaeta sp.]MDX9823952.1 sugar ABC transporter permease [Sphaerochaeta sp.]
MSVLITILKKNVRQYMMVIALVVAMIAFGFLTDGIFFRPVNLTNLVLQNSYVLILAVGMLLCTLTGNVDLSVGSIVCFIGALCGVMMVDLQWNPYMAMLLALLVGALIGMWQGFWIAFVNVPPFIATLAGMLVFRGLGQVIMKGQTKAPFPKEFQMISSGYIPDPLGGLTIGNTQLHLFTLLIGLIIVALIIFGEVKKRKKQKQYDFDILPAGIWLVKVIFIAAALVAFTVVFALYKGFPNILILLGVLVVAYQFVASKTVQGRHIYALGGNRKAAELSGVKVKWVMFWIYTNMAVLAAVAAMVFTARLNSATPKAGQNFEMDAIAACYVGGSAVSGGIGTVIGAVVGGLFIGVLNNGMSIIGISTDWQQAIKGFVLLGAVAFDLYSKSQSSKIA